MLEVMQCLLCKCVLIATVYIYLIIRESGTTEPKPRIVIAGLFPLSDVLPEVRIGLGVRPAVKLALDMINESPDILPHHELQVIANDTKCDMAVATKFFFDMVDSNSTMVMVFGDACSSVSGPMAEIAKEWDVWMLSYADTDPALSDRKKYTNFYRTVPSESSFNPARLALLRKFNWTNVGTIFQGVSKGPARYGHAHNHLVSLLEKNGINVLKSTGFVNDPEPAIKELKETDARIIIGNFDSNMARHVFCQAYVHKMYGHRYQWMILGDYPDDWWRIRDPTIPCTPEELNTTIQGYIATDILPLSSSRGRTESGLTPQEYLWRYKRDNKGHYSKFHAYAFDGVWVIAKTIDAIVRQLRENGTMDLHSNLFRGNIVEETLNRTNFNGVSGPVKFHAGDRVGSILLEQLQGKKIVKIGEYHSFNNKLTNCDHIMWHGDGPPMDRKLVQKEYLRVPRGIYLCVCTLAGCGVLISAFFLMINVCFREHRFIKMSSPNLNNSVIVGCMLTYTSVFLIGLDGGMVDTRRLGNICTSRAWVLSIGFTLAFGAMFSKTWRVHSIFTDIKLNKKVIKDFKLFLLVTILLIIDAVILITWQITDPLRTTEKNLYAQVHVEKDLHVIFVLEYCTSRYMTTWLGLIYAYKGLLLVVGCFLAWETRHVSIPALNDSKYIGMSVYNVVIMCVCGAAVSFVINDQPIPSFVIIGFFIIFCTTITLCLVFVPKIVEIKRDPYGEERKSRTKLKKSKKQNSEDLNEFIYRRNKELVEENIKYRSIIAEKLRILQSLLEQLGEENIGDQLYFVNKSPVHRKMVHLKITDTPASFGSDLEVSDCSDISCGSTSWALGSGPFKRIHVKTNRSVTSLWTDTSLEELADDNSGRKKSDPAKVTKAAAVETDEDDSDLFGGVYLGPPDPPPKKKAEPKLPNGVVQAVPCLHSTLDKEQNGCTRSLSDDQNIEINDKSQQDGLFSKPTITADTLSETVVSANQINVINGGTLSTIVGKVKQMDTNNRDNLSNTIGNVTQMDNSNGDILNEAVGSVNQMDTINTLHDDGATYETIVVDIVNSNETSSKQSNYIEASHCEENNSMDIIEQEDSLKSPASATENRESRGSKEDVPQTEHHPPVGEDNHTKQYSNGLTHNKSQESFAAYLKETLPKQVTKTETLLKNINKKEDKGMTPSLSVDIIEQI